MPCCGKAAEGYEIVWRIAGVDHRDGTPVDFSSQAEAERNRPAGNRKPSMRITRRKAASR